MKTMKLYTWAKLDGEECDLDGRTYVVFDGTRSYRVRTRRQLARLTEAMQRAQVVGLADVIVHYSKLRLIIEAIRRER